jgi:hypothetical protein
MLLTGAAAVACDWLNEAAARQGEQSDRLRMVWSRG